MSTIVKTILYITYIWMIWDYSSNAELIKKIDYPNKINKDGN